MKFIISWDTPSGKKHAIIHAEDYGLALVEAEEQGELANASTIGYDAIDYTKEKAVELGLEQE